MPEIIKVIIPAYNEADSIAKVIAEIPDFVDEIIVVSNNSTDKTEENAAQAGATVLKENRKGYGYACLKGMDYISNQEIKPDIIVFLDGDYSDFPSEMDKIVAPIINDNIDMVIGARVSALREPGSMTFPQRFGNKLATYIDEIVLQCKFHRSWPF